MSKQLKIGIIWYIALGVLALMLIIGTAVGGKNEILQKRTSQQVQILKNLEVTRVPDRTTPLGQYYVYEKKLEKVPAEETGIIFCAIHQEVAVYLNDELVYELKCTGNSHFMKSPGTVWVRVPFEQKDKGKSIRICLTPMYKGVDGVFPTIYYGNQSRIILQVIGEQLLPFALCVLTVCLAMVFIVTGILNYHNIKTGFDIVIMGIFSLILSVWRFTDLNIVKMFVDNARTVSAVALITLPFLAPTFLMYIRNMFHEDKHKLWDIGMYGSLAVISVASLLQLFGIADLRQTLFLHHIVMGVLVVIIFYMVFYEIKKYGMSINIKITMLGIAFCVAGLCSDMIAYYRTSGSNFTSWGMIGFVAYIIILGMNSFNNTRNLMNIARQAQHYEKMAYHDELTGLYNRAAFADNTGAGFKPEGHIIVMCDLNNLKKCNDSFGHEQGDLYIKSSAELLDRIFGKYGKCYRMGGDEFTIILKDLSLESVRIKEDIIADRCKAYNEEHPERFPMNIAFGYAMFNPDEDTDISDTVRRADKMMYIHKFMMKGELGR